MDRYASAQLEEALTHVHDWEPAVHAFVDLREQEARREAAAADAATPQSPLHGQVFAVKEVFDLADVATTGGCRALADNVPQQDAVVVQRLKQAGAICTGALVSHELTFGLDQPPTRNPWDLSCYPGGSSAGAGVAVAVGAARFALGTDAAGSVRIPAAMTGTVGYKPTYGLISQAGVLRAASAPSIDHVGIIAREVAVVTDVLKVIAGPEPNDSRTLHNLPSPPLNTANDISDLSGQRLAVLGPATVGALNETYPLDAEIESVFKAVLEVYRSAGADIVTIELPGLADAIGAVVTLFSVELAVAHRRRLPGHEEQYNPSVAGALRSAFDTPPEQVETAIRTRVALRRAIDDALHSARATFLLTPTTPRVAMPLDRFDPGAELGTLIPYTCGFNLTGHPALSLPSGFTTGGLPIGHQIIGPRFADAGVLSVGQCFQAQTQWHERRPALPTIRP